jgi:hypothetical protein
MTLAVVVALAAICAKHASAESATDLKARFDYLSQHGNVECSVHFENSIATMPSDAKLEGSCCAPMDEARYRQQLDGLKKYSDIAEVPPDPYDISTPLALKLMSYYNMALNKEEQAAYDLCDGALRHAGSMLLQVLALEGLWGARQVPHPHTSFKWSATH